MFDIALALHACGNATDYALAKAGEARAAFIASPCCVGKLKFSLSGGSSSSAEWRDCTVEKGKGGGAGSESR